MAPSLSVQDATPPGQDLLNEDIVPTGDRLTNEQLRSHDVYVGRGCEKLGLSRSEWCNPFRTTKGQSRAVVLQKFSVHARAHLARKVHRLAGCRLLCHCESHQNCHGDVLVELFKETYCSTTSPRRPSCVEDIPLSSSEITQEESPPTSNWRQVEACVGVLILFAGLRRPNSIKDWLVKLSAPMVLCLKPSHSPGLGLLARELALDLAEGVYRPDIAAVLIGGVTNKHADWLSREAEPGRTGNRSAILEESSETVIPPRKRSWYRTLKPLSHVRNRGLS